MSTGPMRALGLTMRSKSSALATLAAAAALAGLPTLASAQDLPDAGEVGELLEAAPLPAPSEAAATPPASARASGAKNFQTGVDPIGLFNGPGASQWADTTVGLGANLARLDLGWSYAVSGPPANPSDPADPAYDFSAIDEAVRNAAARGLRVMITFQEAPRYAQEDGGKPDGSSLPDGAWKPKPEDLQDFAKAVATRYSGTFNGLPRVSDFEAWNEGNLNGFLAPQYEGKKLVAVDRYRRMVIAVENGIDSVHPDNRVVVGSLAPYGEEPGGARTRPLEFLRELFCLNKKLKKTKCPTKTPLDVLSHHPINTSGGPRRSAIDDDDVATPDLGNVEKVLRAAERHGTIAGKRRHHPLWATEFWWSSKKDPQVPASANPNQHARYVEESLYLFWKAGADAAFYYILQDTTINGEPLYLGLYEADGSAKPAVKAFSFPFVTERKSKNKVFAWGKAPEGGKVTIQEKAGKNWRKVHSENVKPGDVFTANLRIRGKAKLRATVGGDQSLVWTQKR